jgi:cytochrome c oxidase assembly protein subunit 15
VVLRLAVTALALNVLLVGTGAAVRVTGSGLGCPSWPQCTAGSVVNTPELGAHGYIEFGNRLLAVLLEVVGILLLLAVRRCATRLPASWTRLAAVQVLVVPLQAVIGGILVLSGLNPYVLILHFLISFPLLLAAAVLVRRAVDGPAEPRVPLVRQELRWLTGALLLTTSAVLALGTLVTGTGPHAGSTEVARLPFDPRDVTQLHADAVFLLVGLTLATALTARALGAPPAVRTAVRALVVLLVAQAALGFVQYFSGTPPLLAGIHALAAAVIFAVAAWAHVSTRGPAPVPPDTAVIREQLPATV